MFLHVYCIWLWARQVEILSFVLNRLSHLVMGSICTANSSLGNWCMYLWMVFPNLGILMSSPISLWLRSYSLSKGRFFFSILFTTSSCSCTFLNCRRGVIDCHLVSIAKHFIKIYKSLNKSLSINLANETNRSCVIATNWTIKLSQIYRINHTQKIHY